MINNLWETDDWKEKSENAMKASGCVKYNHTSGLRSFALRASILVQGSKPTITKLFEDTHKRHRHGGVWINNTAEEHHATMVSKIAEQSQPSVTHPLSEEQISREVLGKRSVHLKGYGIRKDSTSSSTHFEAPNSEAIVFQQQLVDQRQQLADQGNQLLDQAQNMSTMQTIIQMLAAKNEINLANIPGLVPSNNVGEDASGVREDETSLDLAENIRDTEFLGYDTLSIRAVVEALLVNGKPVLQVSKGNEVEVFLNRTPFYAESEVGGEVEAVVDAKLRQRAKSGAIAMFGEKYGEQVAGTSGKALLEGGSNDEGASTEAQGRAIIEVLRREKCNEVLAALYMVRTDVSLTVRQQVAFHVWKTIVANTPKTLKEIMPVLMNTLITSLASSAFERRQVAGRLVGELVRKLEEKVLPLIIPILSRGLKDPNASRRQRSMGNGVCIGLSEMMASAGKSQFMPEVRESAGLAFNTLHKSAGLQAIDEIVPTLLHALEDDETSDTALDGLKQILKAFNAHALGALAEVAGPGLDFHLSTVVPALLTAMDDCNMSFDEEGIEPLISELLKGDGDHQASIRRSSSYLLGYFFKNSKLYLVDEAPNVITTLIVLLSDSDSATVAVAWEALSRVVGSIPMEVLPSYIKLARDVVSTSRDKERRKRKGGPVLIPRLCLPEALQPLLPIFLQGLISGSAELREQAAQGLGELIKVTSEQALKEFVISITGPLIRIIGDQFPWQVKSTILSTLTIMIRKGGMALKPFLPQLQTTFIKCLQDNTSIKLVMDEKVKRSKGYAFIQYTSQEDALLALESMDHKGWLKNRNIAAIKVLSPESSQGVKEFLTEIRVISNIEHQNLVKLYGCCMDEDHKILVYNYLENDSLAQTLIAVGLLLPLPWWLILVGPLLLQCCCDAAATGCWSAA
ncbi:unnamed protein product [Camellia sinensis]